MEKENRYMSPAKSPRYARAWESPVKERKRVGLSVMVAAEVNGAVKNVKFVHAARPTIKMLVAEIEKEFEKNQQDFHAESVQVFAEDAQTWVPLSRQSQIIHNAQIFVRQTPPPPCEILPPEKITTPRRGRSSLRSSTPPKSATRSQSAARRLFSDKLAVVYQEYCGKNSVRYFKEKLHEKGLDSEELLETLKESLGYGATKVSLAQFNRWGRKNERFIELMYTTRKQTARVSPPRPSQPPTPTPLPLPQQHVASETPWYPPTEAELEQYSPAWRETQHKPLKAWLNQEIQRLEEEHRHKIAKLYAELEEMG
eukprot:TRINITY_DN4246_c0_g1_i1.p1 TRINITY_DN4246_c0_g1~~TRINITY_DN4246_c0_g1_i1.p1  ORF type:complete len:325 (+),score=62.62 TRINITY_DN4246_c0_g1_i1:42-977(+)